MAFLRQWLLILFALVLSAGQIFAASTKEQRAYTNAVAAFQDELWSRAENEFAQFVEKYPDSANVAQAVLLQAQAEYNQGQWPQAIALLDARKDQAGNLADQYDYWIGEAQFAGGNFAQAVQTFDLLAEKFPESPLKLRAVIESASARIQLADWPGVERLLEETNGIFQRAAQLDPDGDLVSRGHLLLAQAKFEQSDLNGAMKTLGLVNQRTLTPALDWQCSYLLCRIKIQANDLEGALAATTNLVQVSGTGRDAELRSEGVALRGNVLEKLQRPDEAIAAYRENLAADVPAQQQREAVLKIADLASAQDRFSEAEDALKSFVAQFSNSPAAEIALLTLGELHLKDYTQSAATNQLALAATTFDQFLQTFTNSTLLGKAYLDRGWCNWLAEKYPDSFDDFKTASEKLAPSEDLAVARFKMGDALLAQKNFAGALTNYASVLSDFQDFPAVAQKFRTRALYQSLRADLGMHDLAGANGALAQILKNSPADDFADSGALLLGENLEASQQPAEARALFEEFEKQSPNSPLRPQIELAVARTYAQQQEWTNAIVGYENWLKEFPTNELRAKAAYSLAQANYHAGNETNALSLLTNFVAQFPTNELAPMAQWWIGDHFFNAGDFVSAERNYKMIFQNTNWQATLFQDTNSPDWLLFWQAQMMAGRAAVGRLGYQDAIGYFSALASNTNCPSDLGARAQLAWGGALMLSDSPDTNNPLAYFQTATNIFAQVVLMWPSNEFSMKAWGETGNCDLQLGNYDGATNAYAQVFNSPIANISARSQAQIGFGIALEKKAASATGKNQNALLQMALNNYLDVFYENNLHDGEVADSFWVKKAGLQALNAMETLQEWPQAEKFFARLEQKLPQLKDMLEKRKSALPGKS